MLRVASVIGVTFRGAGRRRGPRRARSIPAVYERLAEASLIVPVDAARRLAVLATR